MDYPHLANAPIREAIIDLRVKHSRGLDVFKFKSIERDLKADYPIIEERRAFTTGFQFNPEKVNVHEGHSEIDAIIFRSEDGKELLQFTKTSFTFNRLEPYTKWDDIVSKAKMGWDLYKDISNPIAITRIAARYINDIKVPTNERLENYLQNSPKVPPNSPTFFLNSLSRISLIEPQDDIIVHLTQTVESKETDVATIILDIDAFKQKEFDVEGESIWSDFEKLREMKNRLFFNSLTETAINQYK